MTDTREKILKAAFQDMRRQGFQGLRADKSIAAAGVTKGALYHYFQNKEEIGLAVIEELIAPDYLLFYESLTRATGADPIALIQEHLTFLTSVSTDENVALGCPLNNLIQEMSPLNETFRQAMQRVTDRMYDCLERALEQGKANGFVHLETPARQSAQFIVSCIEGGFSMAKVRRDASIFKENMEQLSNYLENLRS